MDTIDELKNGRWQLVCQRVLDFRVNADILKCPFCGEETYRISHKIPYYCPNCGARLLQEKNYDK